MATSVLPERPRTPETHAAPASRASWCGQLKLGPLCVPVKAYAAIATPPEIPLRQLHAPCGERIEYRKCCPKHGEVPAEQIVKYLYQPDSTQVTEEELAGSSRPTRRRFTWSLRSATSIWFSGGTESLPRGQPGCSSALRAVFNRSTQRQVGHRPRGLLGKWQIVGIPCRRGAVIHTLPPPMPGPGPWEGGPRSAQDRGLLRLIDRPTEDSGDYQDTWNAG
jgi:hypothetical protein